MVLYRPTAFTLQGPSSKKCLNLKERKRGIFFQWSGILIRWANLPIHSSAFVNAPRSRLTAISEPKACKTKVSSQWHEQVAPVAPEPSRHLLRDLRGYPILQHQYSAEAEVVRRMSKTFLKSFRDLCGEHLRGYACRIFTLSIVYHAQNPGARKSVYLP